MSSVTGVGKDGAASVRKAGSRAISGQASTGNDATGAEASDKLTTALTSVAETLGSPRQAVVDQFSSAVPIALVTHRDVLSEVTKMSHSGQCQPADLDFDAFDQRVAAEHHDAMKAVGSVQLLLMELEEKLRDAQFEIRALNDLDHAIMTYSRRSESFCKWVGLTAEKIKNNRANPQEEFDDVFTSMIYLAMVESFLKFRNVLRELNEKLAAVFEPSDDIKSAVLVCDRLDDTAEIILRFMNMIRKFDLGYKGNPNLVDINDSIRDALGYFPTDKVMHYLVIDTVEQFDSNRQILPMVLIDPDILFKVWLNLATNACEECEKFRLTGVQFKIFARQDGNCIEVRAEDKGPGIDPSIVADPNMILERGFSTKKGKHNKGLGMDIIKRIVEAAGGSIKVESKFGTADSGVTIVMRFPVALGNQQQ